MRMNRCSIALMAVISISMMAGRSEGQGVVRIVPEESTSIYQEADGPSPSDLVVPTELSSEFKDEALKQDNGTWKDGDCQFNCGPLWSVYAGAVILRRDNPDVMGPLPVDPIVLGTPPFDVGTSVGVEIDARRRLGERNELQVRYFGVAGWSDQFEDSGTIGPIQWEAFAGYATRLHSTEINLRRCWTDRVTVLGGFRWVELNEKVDYEINTTTFGFSADFAQRAGAYNNMYGFQLGTDVLLWDRGGPFTVNSEVKAGIYSNLAKNSGALESPIGDIVGDGRKYHTAFLGQLAINAKYQLNRNWALLAGYQMLWVEGVALVNSNQVDALVAGDVDTSGSPFYHGATVGAELRW